MVVLVLKNNIEQNSIAAIKLKPIMLEEVPKEVFIECLRV